MDAFGDNFVNESEVDPAAEFLAREQDQLAGLEDEIDPITTSNVAPAAEGSISFFTFQKMIHLYFFYFVLLLFLYYLF